MKVPASQTRQARAAAEAAEWVCQLESGQMSTVRREAFIDWLRESPMHVAETLRITRLTAMLADHEGWSPMQAGVPIADNVVPLAAAYAPPAAAPLPVQRSFRMRYVAGIAAALAIVTGSGLLLHWQVAATQIGTHAGERRELTLADGSVVRLSPSTAIQVDMQPNLRSIVLERGEAVFRVAKNPLRPFVVSAARSRVQAVGTVFSVARSADTVVVTVTEGRVTVVPSATDGQRVAGKGGSAAIALQANERIAVSAVGVAGAVRRIESRYAPEWEDSQLIFENWRVAEVVAQFNRRNRVQIRIEDDALAARIVSGIFDAGDPRSFVEFLTTVAGVTSTQNKPDEIVIGPHTAGATATVPTR